MTANETNTAAAIRSHTSELADMLSSAVKSLSLDEESVASYKHASGLKFEITFSMSGNEADKDNSAKANNANGTASATKRYVMKHHNYLKKLQQRETLPNHPCLMIVLSKCLCQPSGYHYYELT